MQVKYLVIKNINEDVCFYYFGLTSLTRLSLVTERRKKYQCVRSDLSFFIYFSSYWIIWSTKFEQKELIIGLKTIIIKLCYSIMFSICNKLKIFMFPLKLNIQISMS